MSAERVVLWRHGRTPWNAEDRYQGQSDVDLDEVGEAQAAAAARMLADSDRWRPDLIVSSDLVRASRTAQALADLVGLPVKADPDLRECHGGAWEGLHRDEIHARWPELHRAWRRGEVTRVGETGETREEAGARTAAAVARWRDEVEDGGTLVAVSHGTALKSAVLQLLGLRPEHWNVLGGLANAHWAVLAPGEREEWVLLAWDLGPTGAAVGMEA